MRARMASTTIPAAREKPPARVLVAAPSTPGTLAEDNAAWKASAQRKVESRGDMPSPYLPSVPPAIPARPTPATTSPASQSV